MQKADQIVSDIHCAFCFHGIQTLCGCLGAGRLLNEPWYLNVFHQDLVSGIAVGQVQANRALSRTHSKKQAGTFITCFDSSSFRPAQELI